MNTGNRIYEARTTKGMSRMDLATITGINPCQIRDYNACGKPTLFRGGSFRKKISMCQRMKN